MAMNANVLGDALKAAEDAVVVSYIGEGSNPANAAAYRQARYRAFAGALIAHIQASAEIASLTVTMTPNDGAAHVHTPSSTTTATGKIS